MTRSSWRRSGRADASAARCTIGRARSSRALAHPRPPRRYDHEDLARAAMIEIVLRHRALPRRLPADAWISTVTAHVVFKHLRRRKTERRIFGAVDLELEEPRSRVQVGREVMMRDVAAPSHAPRRDGPEQDVGLRQPTTSAATTCGRSRRSPARPSPRRRRASPAGAARNRGADHPGRPGAADKLSRHRRRDS